MTNRIKIHNTASKVQRITHELDLLMEQIREHIDDGGNHSDLFYSAYQMIDAAGYHLENARRQLTLSKKDAP